MSRPDLSTPEGIAAYRQELRGVARPYRWGGLLLIVLAALMVMGSRQGWFDLGETGVNIGYGLLAVGWGLVLVGILMRTRYHRRRLGEGN